MANKPISADDFQSWKDNAITQAVLAHLNEMKGQIAERWVELLHGEVPADPRPMQIIQVELKAKLEFIEDFISLELSDIQEEAENASTIERAGKARRQA